MPDLISGMPAIELGGGAQLVFEARDATTGGTVSGVTLTDVAIAGSNAGPTGEFGDVLPLLAIEPQSGTV